MDLDELQSVQSRERQTDSLQQLRESFYRDAGEFIEQLRRERDRAAERADDPWNSPEVSRLNDDIDTAEGTVEAIYERRVGKIVKMASLAAADMPTEDQGLTAEERDLFETLVGAIEDNRLQVEAILDGESPTPVEASEERSATAEDPAAADERGADAGSTDSTTLADEATPAETETGEPGQSVDAADLMGEDSPATAPDDRAPPSEERAPPSDERTPPPEEEPAPPSDDALGGSDDDARGDGSGGSSGSPGEADEPRDTSVPDDGAQLDRQTVKITSDVGAIYGVDDREYDLTEEDVVTLPSVNAEPLVERDAAERLE